MSAPPLHQGETAARDARRRFGVGETGPVRDLLDVVEGGAGVPVLIDRFESDDVAGVLLRRADGDAFIAVNADHGSVRQRFTLAHELGHHQMGHQPRLDLTTDLFGGRTRKPQEIEANYFATEFLAPRIAVVAWLEQHDLRGSDVTPETAVQIALQFGIAFAAACYRMERAGAISARVKERLVEHCAQNGGALARAHGAHRLMDGIEMQQQRGIYPRIPRQTVSYAERARAAGLLDSGEFEAIVPNSTDIDFADWLA